MTPGATFPLGGRGLVWLAFYATIVGAWLALYGMTVTADLPRGLGAEFWLALCGGAAPAGFAPLAAMWALMVAAMMLPSFAPALRTYLDLSAVGASEGRGAGALALGYAAVWAAAALAGAALQLGLGTLGLVAPDGSSLSLWLTAGLLGFAGLYQFSAIKAACLSRCRQPLTFFLERWRPGPARALRMGAELGAVCLGCCWALMALAFVGGAMNLLWMGAATLFMAMEKLPGIGRPLTLPAGVLLLTAAAFTALHASDLI